jgi:hypothetical protein
MPDSSEPATRADIQRLELATRADIQRLEHLIADLTQSLSDRLDGIAARLDRQGGWLRAHGMNADEKWNE